MRGQTLIASCLTLGSLLLAATARASVDRVACRVEAVDYQGWHAQQISNAWVKLIFVPQNGGRLMQAIFGGHSYLFVNPQYAGKYLPPAPGKWFNYGGDKLWPLPEGTEDEEHWAGGSDVLDDGPYSFETSSLDGRCAITLTGPADPRTGLQFARTVSLGSDSPQIHFHAWMKNSTGHPIEWSVQSVSQYATADPADSARFNRGFRAYTPANPQSSYLNRYHVRFGPAENPFPAVQPDGLFTLRYGYLAAELWLDSTAGWVAVTDATTGYAVVERFRYQDQARYPGKASVIFWTNGPQVHLDDQGVPSIPPQNPLDTPYYMEAELNSPLVRLAPGEAYSFDTDWFPTRCGPEFAGVTAAAAVLEPLRARRSGSTSVRLTGSFGVFSAGRLMAHIYGRDGRLLSSTPLAAVDPSQPVALDQIVAAPGDATRVSLHLEDQAKIDRGALGEAQVEPPAQAQ